MNTILLFVVLFLGACSNAGQQVSVQHLTDGVPLQFCMLEIYLSDRVAFNYIVADMVKGQPNPDIVTTVIKGTLKSIPETEGEKPSSSVLTCWTPAEFLVAKVFLCEMHEEDRQDMGVYMVPYLIGKQVGQIDPVPSRHQVFFAATLGTSEFDAWARILDSVSMIKGPIVPLNPVLIKFEDIEKLYAEGECRQDKML